MIEGSKVQHKGYQDCHGEIRAIRLYRGTVQALVAWNDGSKDWVNTDNLEERA